MRSDYATLLKKIVASPWIINHRQRVTFMSFATLINTIKLTLLIAYLQKLIMKVKFYKTNPFNFNRFESAHMNRSICKDIRSYWP